MPTLRPLTTRLSQRAAAPRRAPAPRALATTAARRAAPSHDDHYDPPAGWLWGVPPGEAPAREGWEGVWVWGFFGGLGLATVAYCYKPDTRYVGRVPFVFWRGEGVLRRVAMEWSGVEC